MLCPRGRQLSALLQVARRTRPPRPPVGVLLDGQVPHVPRMGAVIPQHRLLGGCWQQPIAGHSNTLATTTDIPWEVKRRSDSGLQTRVSTPRSL